MRNTYIAALSSCDVACCTGDPPAAASRGKNINPFASPQAAQRPFREDPAFVIHFLTVESPRRILLAYGNCFLQLASSGARRLAGLPWGDLSRELNARATVRRIRDRTLTVVLYSSNVFFPDGATPTWLFHCTEESNDSSPQSRCGLRLAQALNTSLVLMHHTSEHLRLIRASHPPVAP